MWKSILGHIVVIGIVAGILDIVVISSHGLVSQLASLWVFIGILVLEDIWTIWESYKLDVRVGKLEDRIKELENQ